MVYDEIYNKVNFTTWDPTLDFSEGYLIYKKTNSLNSELEEKIIENLQEESKFYKEFRGFFRIQFFQMWNMDNSYSKYLAKMLELLELRLPIDEPETGNYITVNSFSPATKYYAESKGSEMKGHIELGFKSRLVLKSQNATFPFSFKVYNIIY
jgi:hypothetical protein